MQLEVVKPAIFPIDMPFYTRKEEYLIVMLKYQTAECLAIIYIHVSSPFRFQVLSQEIYE